MELSEQLARHWKAVFTGGNWTSVNLRDTLSDVDLKRARTQVRGVNAIAALTYHLNYYTEGVLDVFAGKPLVIRDKYAWDLPELKEEDNWNRLRQRLLASGDKLADAIAAFPNDRWEYDFTDAKYGSYLSNIMGLTEHAHYHLGQMVIIKKLLRA
jgi:hypothetical protein